MKHRYAELTDHFEFLPAHENGAGVAPFPFPISKCTAANASPYILSIDSFTRIFGGSDRRRELLKSLALIVNGVSNVGATGLGLLVGGSFLVTSESDPRDLDCILFYSAEAVPTATGLLKELWHQAHSMSIDIRLVPYDANPLIALRACSFFSILYGRTRESAELSRGCVLVSLVGAG